MGEVLRLSQPARPVRVDRGAIDALEAALGPEACAELVEDAVLEAADRLGAIERALEAEDFTAAGRAARSLAEGAGRIGLSPVAAQARALAECCARLDRTAALATGQRLLRTGEAALYAGVADGVG
jgi:HPt (histidine-containing phosphotransfer) domain-containing protein